jgi:hypothetical protein
MKYIIVFQENKKGKGNEMFHNLLFYQIRMGVLWILIRNNIVYDVHLYVCVFTYLLYSIANWCCFGILSIFGSLFLLFILFLFYFILFLFQSNCFTYEKKQI